MIIELVCLGGGILPGRLLRRHKSVVRLTGLIVLGTIYALLFIMGARLGTDVELFASLRQIGIKGLIISICCILGSILAMLPIRSLFAERVFSAGKTKSRGGFFQGFKGSLIILGFFCLGLFLGRLNLLPAWVNNADLFMYNLWLMLLTIGMGMGFDLEGFLVVRELGMRAVLVPALVTAGTGLGALAAFFLLPGAELRETLVAGAGFGYYSLSSAVVSGHGEAALGSVTMIANLSRELITLLTTPLMVRLFGPLAPVAASGATGMDTCLPGIVHFTNERYGILAVFNGLCISILVPLLIPLLLTLLY